MTTYKLQKGIMGTHNVAVLKDDVTSIPLDEANADYQRYIEDLKIQGISILTCTDADGAPDKSMWQYLDNAEQLVIDKYGSDPSLHDKMTALREDRYVRAMKAEFPTKA